VLETSRDSHSGSGTTCRLYSVGKTKASASDDEEEEEHDEDDDQGSEGGGGDGERASHA